MFKKLDGIEGGSGGCLCCGYQHEIAPLPMIVGVGFGFAAVTKNGDTIFQETAQDEKWRSLRVFEWMARKEPDADWRVHLEAPLSERHYQRQGKNHWVLYKKGMGFA